MVYSICVVNLFQFLLNVTTIWKILHGHVKLFFSEYELQRDKNQRIIYFISYGLSCITKTGYGQFECFCLKIDLMQFGFFYFTYSNEFVDSQIKQLLFVFINLPFLCTSDGLNCTSFSFLGARQYTIKLHIVFKLQNVREVY